MDEKNIKKNIAKNLAYYRKKKWTFSKRISIEVEF